MLIVSGRCQNCLVLFEYQKARKAPDGVVFCSRPCFFQYRKLYGHPVAGKKNKWAAFAKRHETKVRVSDAPGYARILSGIRTGRLTPINCVECGVLFSRMPGSYNRGWCSEQCRDGSRKKKQVVTRRLNRQGNNYDRAKKKGLERFYFKENFILERDKYVCQICGVKTPKKLRGKHEPTSPEVDHIVPIAHGGGHVPENCQCLCRACNLSKGAKAKGQLGLLGFSYQQTNAYVSRCAKETKVL